MAQSLDLGRLGTWASERLGFDPRAVKMDRLAEAGRAEALRLGSVEAFDRALEHHDPGVEDALVLAVTVGETYFFRQREHFDLLAQLPALRQPRLLAWSAGCSSGEEAYSLAATLRGLTRLEAPALTVWGTDVNEAALDQARAAHYGRWSWRDVNAVAARMQEAQTLEPANRACVHFAQHNLLQAPIFDAGQGERFDLVFCRNVLVYFSPLAAARALAAITDAMRPGAWLVLGNTDLPGAPSGFTRIGPLALCVYAKDGPKAPDPAPEVRTPALEQAAAPAAPAPVPAMESEPVEWHRQALKLIEEGQRSAALKELERLVRAFPGYVPGRFELALALRRGGHSKAALAELKALLAQVAGRDMAEDVPGPEPLSMEFYVSSARSFISSSGGEA
jgi:chemotaxis protein methyltransferase CheR